MSAAAVQPRRLFADAGCDAEWVHESCREEWYVESGIKPARRRSDGGLNGRDRSQTTEETLPAKNDGGRWRVESFMSGLKRTTGSALRARSERSLFIEAALRVLAYALRRQPGLELPVTFQQSKTASSDPSGRLAAGLSLPRPSRRRHPGSLMSPRSGR